jgi:hypothetical protein
MLSRLKSYRDRYFDVCPIGCSCLECALKTMDTP